ncbi:MAG: hypothetical protein LVQ95_04355 [Candidatus Micrarchaeales archaeon]|nr:hypothetical protein [Candidatus Micrarchaeales archaeon]
MKRADVGFIEIVLSPFSRLTKVQKELVKEAAESYSSFVGKAVALSY